MKYFLGIAFLASVLCEIFLPSSNIQVQMAIAPLVVAAGISAGASLLGGLLSKKDYGLPDWFVKDLQKYAGQNRYSGFLGGDSMSGFLPDKGVFDASLQAKLDEFGAQLGINQEAFNTDLASRGIYSAGEAPKFLYQDVMAPIYRAGASATAQSQLEYSKMYQQGRFGQEDLRFRVKSAEEQTKLQYQQLLMQALLGKQQSTQGIIGDFLGGAGELGMNYAMMQMLLGD